MSEMQTINPGNEGKIPPPIYNIAQLSTLLTFYSFNEDRSCSLNKLTIKLRTRMSIQTQAVNLLVTDASRA